VFDVLLLDSYAFYRCGIVYCSWPVRQLAVVELRFVPGQLGGLQLWNCALFLASWAVCSCGIVVSFVQFMTIDLFAVVELRLVFVVASYAFCSVGLIRVLYQQVG